jgi:hypothetical protein
MRAAALLLAAFVPIVVGGANDEVRAQGATVIIAADLGTHLQPIAQLGAAGWVGVPAAGLGRLAPGDWTRWTLDGRSAPIRLSVREPTGRCAEPRRMPVANSTTPQRGTDYVGIAASGPIDAEPVRQISEGSSDWTRIAAAAHALFERREREHGVSSSAFARVPMTLDRAYEGGRSSTSYYFEASKRVFDAGGTPEEDPKGIVRITVSGWLREADGRLVPAGTKGELYWDPVDEHVPVPESALAPIGVLRHDSNQIWVMNGHTGVRDSFTLYALGATVRPLSSTDAAAC